MPGMEWHSRSHTNSLIPLYVRGVGSELFTSYADQFDPVRGRFIDNAEIGQILFILLDGAVVASIEPATGTALTSTSVTRTESGFRSGTTATFTDSSDT